jgi:hypothetical protein
MTFLLYDPRELPWNAQALTMVDEVPLDMTNELVVKGGGRGAG